MLKGRNMKNNKSSISKVRDYDEIGGTGIYMSLPIIGMKPHLLISKLISNPK